MILFAKAIVTASVCERVFAYYQVVIVSLDCSSDIQQIKQKGDILSLVTRSIKEKALNVLNAHCIYNRCAQGDWRGLQSMWVLNNMGSIHILHHRENDCTEMLCFIIYNFCIFPSLCSAFFPHLNYRLMLRLTESLCHYMPLCSKVNMWIKPRHDGINPLA